MMRNFCVYFLCSVLVCPFLISCDDKDKDENETPKELSPVDFFVLARGNWNQNNASLGYYNAATDEYEADYFAKQNNDRLGELAEQMLIYGNKMYITVGGSNSIIVNDLNAKTIEVIKPQEDETMGPRGLAAYNGKVYVGYYNNHSVAILDTTSLTISDKKIQVGRYPEQMAVANGKLYVTNSGGLDWDETAPDYGYDKTVSVIDLLTLELVEKIEVEINPSKILANSQGDLFVISMGNYNDVLNTLQKIDGKTNKVQVVSNASLMTIVGDNLYTIYSQLTTQQGEKVAEIKYVKYNALTNTIEDNSFIKSSPLKSPYSLNVNPLNGDIYINEYVWGVTNDIYIFDRNGNQRAILETDAYDIAGVCFCSLK